MTPWWRDRWLPPVWLAGVLIAIGYGALQGGHMLPLTTLALLILVYPVLEEVVFRGVIQPALLEVSQGRSVGPLTLANILTSGLFAAMHLINHLPLHAALVFLPSLLFGLFRDRSGSILPGMILHVSWNAAVFLAAGLTT
ncbi:MAG: JDVT-CTERM system CAAX-type protease [Gammaproteobacteria bacterium]|nr:MAG: JDVT-CTERM system CAAX-type protease [Gammaproteobacteria bacterium]